MSKRTFELILNSDKAADKVMASIDAPTEDMAVAYFMDKSWPVGFHNGQYFEVKEKLRVRYIS